MRACIHLWGMLQGLHEIIHVERSTWGLGPISTRSVRCCLHCYQHCCCKLTVVPHGMAELLREKEQRAEGRQRAACVCSGTLMGGVGSHSFLPVSMRPVQPDPLLLQLRTHPGLSSLPGTLRGACPNYQHATWSSSSRLDATSSMKHSWTP